MLLSRSRRLAVGWLTSVPTATTPPTGSSPWPTPSPAICASSSAGRSAADHVVPVADLVQSQFAAVSAFTERGQGVVVQTPIYPPFLNAVRETGRRIVEHRLVDDGSRYVLDAATLPDVFDEQAPLLHVVQSAQSHRAGLRAPRAGGGRRAGRRAAARRAGRRSPRRPGLSGLPAHPLRVARSRRGSADDHRHVGDQGLQHPWPEVRADALWLGGAARAFPSVISQSTDRQSQLVRSGSHDRRVARRTALAAPGDGRAGDQSGARRRLPGAQSFQSSSTMHPKPRTYPG